MKSIILITIITMIVSSIIFYFLFTNIFGYNPNLQYGVDPYVVVSANGMAFLMTIILIILIEGIIVANIAIFSPFQGRVTYNIAPKPPSTMSW